VRTLYTDTGFRFDDERKTRPARRYTILCIIALLALAALQVADIATTYHIINMGGVELNPIMAPVVARPPALYACKALLIGSASLLALTAVRWRVPRPAALTLTALAGYYCFVVAHNLVSIAAGGAYGL
jgi:hypothetical protein